MKNMKTNSMMLSTISMAVASMLSGCGALSSKDENTKAEQTNIALTGEWTNSCTARTWLAGGAQEKQSRKFTMTGEYQHDTTVYSDAQCNTAEVTVRQQGTYDDLGNSGTVSNARDINFTITGATITPNSDSAVSSLNSASYCNLTNWTKDQASDVLGRECLGSNHPKGQVIFDVYRLDSNSSRLALGQGTLFLDKGDAQSRPSSINEGQTFLRP